MWVHICVYVFKSINIYISNLCLCWSLVVYLHLLNMEFHLTFKTFPLWVFNIHFQRLFSAFMCICMYACMYIYFHILIFSPFFVFFFYFHFFVFTFLPLFLHAATATLFYYCCCCCHSLRLPTANWCWKSIFLLTITIDGWFPDLFVACSWIKKIWKKSYKKIMFPFTWAKMNI